VLPMISIAIDPRDPSVPLGLSATLRAVGGYPTAHHQFRYMGLIDDRCRYNQPRRFLKDYARVVSLPLL
jgi:hypothetical protein